MASERRSTSRVPDANIDLQDSSAVASACQQWLNYAQTCKLNGLALLQATQWALRQLEILETLLCSSASIVTANTQCNNGKKAVANAGHSRYSNRPPVGKDDPGKISFFEDTVEEIGGGEVSTGFAGRQDPGEGGELRGPSMSSNENAMIADDDISLGPLPQAIAIGSMGQTQGLGLRDEVIDRYDRDPPSGLLIGLPSEVPSEPSDATGTSSGKPEELRFRVLQLLNEADKGQAGKRLAQQVSSRLAVEQCASLAALIGQCLLFSLDQVEPLGSASQATPISSANQGPDHSSRHGKRLDDCEANPASKQSMREESKQTQQMAEEKDQPMGEGPQARESPLPQQLRECQLTRTSLESNLSPEPCPQDRTSGFPAKKGRENMWLHKKLTWILLSERPGRKKTWPGGSANEELTGGLDWLMARLSGAFPQRLVPILFEYLATVGPDRNGSAAEEGRPEIACLTRLLPILDFAVSQAAQGVGQVLVALLQGQEQPIGPERPEPCKNPVEDSSALAASPLPLPLLVVAVAALSPGILAAMLPHLEPLLNVKSVGKILAVHLRRSCGSDRGEAKGQLWSRPVPPEALLEGAESETSTPLLWLRILLHRRLRQLAPVAAPLVRLLHALAQGGTRRRQTSPAGALTSSWAPEEDAPCGAQPPVSDDVDDGGMGRPAAIGGAREELPAGEFSRGSDLWAAKEVAPAGRQSTEAQQEKGGGGLSLAEEGSLSEGARWLLEGLCCELYSHHMRRALGTRPPPSADPSPKSNAPDLSPAAIHGSGAATFLTRLQENVEALWECLALPEPPEASRKRQLDQSKGGGVDTWRAAAGAATQAVRNTSAVEATEAMPAGKRQKVPFGAYVPVEKGDAVQPLDESLLKSPGKALAGPPANTLSEAPEGLLSESPGGMRRLAEADEEGAQTGAGPGGHSGELPPLPHPGDWAVVKLAELAILSASRGSALAYVADVVAKWTVVGVGGGGGGGGGGEGSGRAGASPGSFLEGAPQALWLVRRVLEAVVLWGAGQQFAETWGRCLIGRLHSCSQEEALRRIDAIEWLLASFPPSPDTQHPSPSGRSPEPLPKHAPHQARASGAGASGQEQPEAHRDTAGLAAPALGSGTGSDTGVGQCLETAGGTDGIVLEALVEVLDRHWLGFLRVLHRDGEGAGQIHKRGLALLLELGEWRPAGASTAAVRLQASLGLLFHWLDQHYSLPAGAPEEPSHCKADRWQRLGAIQQLKRVVVQLAGSHASSLAMLAHHLLDYSFLALGRQDPPMGRGGRLNGLGPSPRTARKATAGIAPMPSTPVLVSGTLDRHGRFGLVGASRAEAAMAGGEHREDSHSGSHSLLEEARRRKLGSAPSMEAFPTPPPFHQRSHSRRVPLVKNGHASAGPATRGSAEAPPGGGGSVRAGLGKSHDGRALQLSSLLGEALLAAETGVGRGEGGGGTAGREVGREGTERGSPLGVVVAALLEKLGTPHELGLTVEQYEEVLPRRASDPRHIFIVECVAQNPFLLDMLQMVMEHGAPRHELLRCAEIVRVLLADAIGRWHNMVRARGSTGAAFRGVLTTEDAKERAHVARLIQLVAAPGWLPQPMASCAQMVSLLDAADLPDLLLLVWRCAHHAMTHAQYSWGGTPSSIPSLDSPRKPQIQGSFSGSVCPAKGGGSEGVESEAVYTQWEGHLFAILRRNMGRIGGHFAQIFPT